MTIREAVERGIDKIRKPHWVKTAYLQLDLFPGGMHGPCMHLYDPPTQEAIGVPTPQDLFWKDDGESDWEKWEG